ncbi:response regulator [Lewinella sp. IMCC34191]|uniref:response regulator n=1 Tax=Lewinella sp. IMCC34191 TaxID=2259172 RepID=UPI000E267062|nr:response regulator [Lewinella sp. IMCC34191]
MDSLLNSTVFIVDDDPFTCSLYQKHLHNLGFSDTHLFHSGVDCLNNLHLNPAIVLLDHDMSQLTGFEVLKKIKRYDPDASVIMVSGQEDMATALDALKYGAFDYIIKGDTEVQRIEHTLYRLARLREMMSRRSKSLLGKLMPNG